jgi:hypothetical protein
VVPAVSGQYTDPRNEKSAEINLFNSRDKESLFSLAEIRGTFHIHPSGVAHQPIQLERPGTSTYSTKRGNVHLVNRHHRWKWNVLFKVVIRGGIMLL